MQPGQNHQALPDPDLPRQVRGVGLTNASNVTGAQAQAEPPALGYVYQQSSDLRFLLSEGPAPRGAVRVLVEREIQIGKGRVTLAIIGSSHFLEIRSGATTLCELLACPRPELEGMSRILEKIPAATWSHRFRKDGIRYQFQFSRRRLTADRFEETSAALSTAAPGRISYVFPGRAGGENALTCVEWQVEGQRVDITTYHTFPDELAVARTRSVVDFVEVGAPE